MIDRRLTGSAASLTVLLLTGGALAQDAAPPPTVQADAGGPALKGKTEAVAKPDDTKRPEGWTPGVAFGGTFNLIDTRGVVGSQDGTALNLGAALDSQLDFNQDVHEWRNSLKHRPSRRRAGRHDRAAPPGAVRRRARRRSASS